MCKKYPSIHLHIGGDGEHKSNLMNLVLSKSLNGNIVFYGYLSPKELVKFYSNIDLFVFASISEGIANVILEALACGLLIVSTNVGDIPIHLDEGRGFLFNVGNYKRLAGIIEDIYLSEVDTETDRRKRRDFICKNHSFKCVKEQYLNFFQSVGKKHPHGNDEGIKCNS